MSEMLHRWREVKLWVQLLGYGLMCVISLFFIGLQLFRESKHVIVTRHHLICHVQSTCALRSVGLLASKQTNELCRKC